MKKMTTKKTNTLNTKKCTILTTINFQKWGKKGTPPFFLLKKIELRSRLYNKIGDLKYYLFSGPFNESARCYFRSTKDPN